MFLPLSEPSDGRNADVGVPDESKISTPLCYHKEPSTHPPAWYSQISYVHCFIEQHPLNALMCSNQTQRNPKRIGKMEARSHLITLFLFVFLFFFCGLVCKVGAAAVSEKCSNDFTKVVPCLDFAKGVAETPTKECCTAVTQIKSDDPVCLCYFIQQTHNGSAQIKSLGIQEAKLLQLPTACSLKNASVTECPKLLGLSPNSAEAAIFSNTSASTATPTTGSSSSALEKANGNRIGTGLGPIFAALLAVAVALVLCLSPMGPVATFDT